MSVTMARANKMAEAAAGNANRLPLTIGAVAKEFGTTHRALRFYEEKGLLKPMRHGPHRLYSQRDLEALKLILMGKRFGFLLSEIREMLSLYNLRDGRIRHPQAVLNRFDEQIGILIDQKQEIEVALTQLKQARRAIQGLAVEAPSLKRAKKATRAHSIQNNAGRKKAVRALDAERSLRAPF